MNEQEIPEPSQGESVISYRTMPLTDEKDHQHLYKIVTNDDVVIRYCETCGISWIYEPQLKEWRKIRESE